MKFSVRVADVSFETGTTITNWVISHITFIRATLPLRFVKWPSNQRSAWRIAKGELIVQKSMTSWPRCHHFNINVQCGRCFTQSLISVRIHCQKNRSFNRYNVLSSPIRLVASEACMELKIIHRRERGTIMRQRIKINDSITNNTRWIMRYSFTISNS